MSLIRHPQPIETYNLLYIKKAIKQINKVCLYSKLNQVDKPVIYARFP